MKKILYGTTALVAAGMFAGAASAAEAMKASVSGYQHFYLIYGSQSDNAGEPAANLRNHGMRKEGEVHFKASTTMDNGVKVGWESEFEAESGTNDENYVWMSGNFGKIDFGGNWGPALLMAHQSPGSGAAWGDFANNSAFTAPGAGNAITGPNSYANVIFKANKIAYYTPRMASGVQLGVAYVPDVADAQTSNGGFSTDNAAGTNGSGYEAGINLVTKAGGSDIKASAVYTKIELEAAQAGSEDQVVWGVGANITSGNYSFGFGYKTDNEGDTTDSDEVQWSLGATMKAGPWKYALNHVSGEDENGGGTNADDITMNQLSATYAWGPGVTLGMGVQNVKFEDGGSVAANENSATTVFLGTQLSF